MRTTKTMYVLIDTYGYIAGVASELNKAKAMLKTFAQYVCYNEGTSIKASGDYEIRFTSGLRIRISEATRFDTIKAFEQIYKV